MPSCTYHNQFYICEVYRVNRAEFICGSTFRKSRLLIFFLFKQCYSLLKIQWPTSASHRVMDLEEIVRVVSKSLSASPSERRKWVSHTTRPVSPWWIGALAALLLLAAIPSAAQAPISVTTYQYNNQRTGVNSNETILTPANVNSLNFGRLFSQTVDGDVFAQPLYVPSVTINGTVHNVIYVATEHDSVYAFDADSNTGVNAQPLWRTSFLSTGVATVSSGALGVYDINPEYGITGTPVIDGSTNTLYVVAETLENNGISFVKRLHALDISTGAEKTGSPVLISASASVPGQSTVTFDPQWEQQRGGLLLYSGVVYIPFGSHGDDGDWRGWILGYSYNGSTLAQVFVFCSEPSAVNGAGGGIWQNGQGLSMDTGSNLFTTTGNGYFDTTGTPPIDYGDSVVRMDLSQGPTIQDYFTSWNQAAMFSQNLDLSGIAILPAQPGPYPNLLVASGKDSNIYVLNRDSGRMGQFNSSSNKIVQELDAVVGGMFSAPVYFNGKIYFWGSGDVLKAFTLTSGTLSTSPTDRGTDTFGFPGAMPTISANGTSNGILWALNSSNWSNSGPGGAGELFAYNANNLSAGAIYTTFQNSGDATGGAIKFAVPIVANGKVYVEAEGQISVYGLRSQGQTAPSITSSSSATIAVGTAGSFTVTTTGAPTPSLSKTGTLPSGVTFVDNGNGTATLGGTPATGTAGSYPITITASNGVGTAATQSFTLTVNGAGTAPTITSANKTTLTLGTAGSFTVSTTGIPTPSLSETGTLPNGVTFKDNGNGTATLGGTPATGTVGSYPITIIASNGVGTAASQGFTLTVQQLAPAITSANSTTFTVGTAGSFKVTTIGAPTPSLNETGALPNGVTFIDNDNGTATLSGTPATGTAGSYPITITASNGVGTDATQSFTLTVSGGGGSNFAYVAGSVTAAMNSGAGPSKTLAVTLHQNPGAGHLLICAATWQSDTATASMSDPNNGTWVAIGSARVGIGSLSAYRGQMFYVPSAVNASTTVTLTISSAVGFRAFECAEYSYTGTITTLDGTPQYSTTPASGSVATIGGLTTSNTSDLVFAACLGVDTTCVVGSGYTLRNDTNAYDALGNNLGHDYLGYTGQLIEDKVGVGAGTQSATFGTGTPSDNVILGLVAP